MNRKVIASYAAILVVGSASLQTIPAVNAAGFNPMTMMNPSKWMGGNRDGNYDDYPDDYYGGGPYGGPYGGGPYGGGPYGGGPYGGGPGWGGPYGAPGWGGGYPGAYGAAGPGGPYGAPYGTAPYGGAPGYSAPTASEPAPSNRELLDRLEKLEAEQQRLAYPPPPPAPAKDAERSYSAPDSGGYNFPDSTYQSPQLWR